MKKTSIRFGLIEHGDRIRVEGEGWKSEVLRILLQDLAKRFPFEINEGEKVALPLCLDDVCEEALKCIFKGDLQKLLSLRPKDGNKILPLFFVPEYELKAFAELRGVKITERRKSFLREWLDSVEQGNPGVKHAMARALLKLQSTLAFGAGHGRTGIDTQKKAP